MIAAQWSIYMEIICRFVSFVHLTMRNQEFFSILYSKTTTTKGELRKIARVDNWKLASPSMWGRGRERGCSWREHLPWWWCTCPSPYCDIRSCRSPRNIITHVMSTSPPPPPCHNFILSGNNTLPLSCIPGVISLSLQCSALFALSYRLQPILSEYSDSDNKFSSNSQSNSQFVW